jgi:regulatory factor X
MPYDLLLTIFRLKGTCRKSGASVPRNRVYTKYAERCSTERVIPLNPASFGKLVRVIFPSIQTRRLGVRGESKYHYVDLELVNVEADDAEETSRPGTGQVSRQSLNRQDSNGPKLDFNSFPRLPADTAAFPPQNPTFETESGYYAANSSRGRLFSDINTPEFRSSGRTADAYEYDLRFPSNELLNARDSLDIVLPDIGPHTPNKTDPDSVEALVALYRTHCTSLIDSVRYCKEKQFFRLYESFHGTLTQPVQKLFAMPGVDQWIRKCDYLMYQKMIRNVSQLTLQVAPAPVLKFLDNVTKQLHTHISKVFQAQGHPSHVLEAKLEPAVVFAHLLRQMLRVNSTAHAAAVMLTVDDNRDRMWADYQAYVNAKRVIENELPQTCAAEEVFNILNTEIRGLLLPLKPETWLPDGTFYQITTPDPHVDPMQETVIDRIAAFLTRLPSRFPNAPARTVLHVLNAVGSGIVREITVENGPSFQGWWLTKVFIDEMAQWLASLGGFLSYCPATGGLASSPQLMVDSINDGLGNAGNGSNDNSRFSSMGTELGANQSFLSNGDVSMQEGGSAVQGSEYPSSPFLAW